MIPADLLPLPFECPLSAITYLLDITLYTKAHVKVERFKMFDYSFDISRSCGSNISFFEHFFQCTTNSLKVASHSSDCIDFDPAFLACFSFSLNSSFNMFS